VVIQVHNPSSLDVRLGDKLYDIANDILWVVENLSRNDYIAIRYKERRLVIPQREFLSGYILIREVNING